MPIAQVITPRQENVGGQPILRPLPSAQCRNVGPFVFFDYILPHEYPPGHGMNIHQHPHIGLSTLTYLFEGELLHKDSLGSEERVVPGAVSWMTAGREIAHIERTPSYLMQAGSRLHGLQVWLAMPRDHEADEPSYYYFEPDELPSHDEAGVRITLVAGHGFRLISPVPVLSPTLYAVIDMAAGSSLLIPDEHAERAVFLLEGDARLGSGPVDPHTLVVLEEGAEMTLSSGLGARLALVGGAALDGPRRMNWNFVASDPALIERARARWAVGDWPQVSGETGRVELPGPARRS
ncbi:pirin family protein [Pseudomonas sp. RIT-PI-S]|uniref:pirin family protein n=1 Tax=Pseudomonas sp. RIT-PI-S TaxID=3035295 RepID=UPI0021D81727|nr:pirin family protein [Pseudomonas sp. RIT-PI-S]